MKILKKAMRWIRSEAAKVKKLSFQDRVWYIWEYYKLHFFVSFMIIALLVAWISALSNSSDSYLHCALINLTMPMQAAPTDLTDGFHAALNLSAKEIVTADSFCLHFDANMDELSYASLEKIIVQTAVSELDLIFTTNAACESMVELGLIGNLEELLPAQSWNMVKEYAVYLIDPETGNLFPAALDVSSSSVIKEYNFQSDSVLVSLSPTTSHTENCVLMLQYLYSQR